MTGSTTMKPGTLLLALALSSGAGALLAGDSPAPPSGPPPVLEAAPEGTVVFDDDGGRAQVIPRQAAPGAEPTFHGGPIVARANVKALFMGSAWRESENKAARQRATDSLARLERAAEFSALSRYGLEAKERPLASQDDFLDPADAKKISDLELQARLDRLFQTSMGELEAESVFVVFLAPGIKSTLGTASSEKDYASYHNHLHAAAGLIRYVVVPFDADAGRWLKSTRQSLIQAMINPEGNAWY